MRLSPKREVWGSHFGPIKLDAVLPTARYSCDISSRGAVLPTGTMIRRWAPQTRYTLRRNTASIKTDLIIVFTASLLYTNNYCVTVLKANVLTWERNDYNDDNNSCRFHLETFFGIFQIDNFFHEKLFSTVFSCTMDSITEWNKDKLIFLYRSFYELKIFNKAAAAILHFNNLCSTETY